MAFSQPIVDVGGTLVRDSIKSSDYVPGVSGWTINRDGSAEFNDGTFRGEIIIGTPGGARVEIIGDSIQIYDASDNVVAQMTSTNFGILSTEGGVFINPGAQPQVIFNLNDDGVHSFPSLGSIIQYETGTPHFQPVMQIEPANLSGKGGPALTLLAETADGASNFPFATSGFEFTGDTALWLPQGGGNSGLWFDLTVPGIYQEVSGVKENWHALTLQNGWTNRGGTDVTAQYRKIASPPNTVEIVGYIASGTVTDGTVLFTLPAGYRPAHNVVFPVYTANVTAGRTALLTAKTDGTCTITFLSGATSVGFHCLIPLDA